ncbi:MAG: LysM peptidoglycan-binding domain-containing protein [Planctomycetes bacterium]|nr:LysM peptidoglycan-binding domain-containing protein [Planctomycetota bacterium]
MKYALAVALVLALAALVLLRLRPADSAADAANERLRPGWGSVVLGAPSGAEIPVPEATPPAAVAQAPAAPSAPGVQPQVPPPTAPAAREFELVVSPGQSLSVICKEHYGTAAVKLVEALARFNGLPSADALRSGVKLRLPPIEDLQAP